MGGGDGRDEKRAALRVDVEWPVDCETEDTFLFAAITNVSQLGIFVCTEEPLEVGRVLSLKFSPPESETFVMRGRVQWVNKVRAFGENPNPGMGLVFTDLTPEDRERLVAVIRTIAYVRDTPVN